MAGRKRAYSQAAPDHVGKGVAAISDLARFHTHLNTWALGRTSTICYIGTGVKAQNEMRKFYNTGNRPVYVYACSQRKTSIASAPSAQQ